MIIDLHCDLPSYLITSPNATAYDLQARCAIPQLREGGVKLQVMTIYTDRAVERGLQQLEIMASLPEKYPDDLYFFEGEWEPEKIAVLPAIENLSALCGEEEPLDRAFERLESLPVKPLYISLTWNGENRFGGGAATNIGLKPDGKIFLEYLRGKNIAVDLSHTSDALAYDLLNYDVPIMASHSNCRALSNLPRNLPDDLIVEVIKREGLLGVNFIDDFVGDVSILDHIEHIIALGGEKCVALGADFFFEKDEGIPLTRPPEKVFIPGYDTSACYPKLINEWSSKLKQNQLSSLQDVNIEAFMSACYVH